MRIFPKTKREATKREERANFQPLLVELLTKLCAKSFCSIFPFLFVLILFGIFYFVLFRIFDGKSLEKGLIFSSYFWSPKASIFSRN